MKANEIETIREALTEANEAMMCELVKIEAIVALTGAQE